MGCETAVSIHFMGRVREDRAFDRISRQPFESRDEEAHVGNAFVELAIARYNVQDDS